MSFAGHAGFFVDQWIGEGMLRLRKLLLIAVCGMLAFSLFECDGGCEKPPSGPPKGEKPTPEVNSLRSLEREKEHK